MKIRLWKQKTEKQIFWQIFTFLLVVIWMAVIFHFSAQDATKSSGLSESVSQTIVRLQSTILHLGWTKRKIMEISILIETPVRKMAHASEYALLAALLWLHLGTWERFRIKGRELTAEAVAVCYAITDELHQFASDGRSPQIRDVLIDAAGACTALLVLYFVKSCVMRKRRKRQQEQKQHEWQE